MDERITVTSPLMPNLDEFNEMLPRISNHLFVVSWEFHGELGFLERQYLLNIIDEMKEEIMSLSFTHPKIKNQ